MEEEQLAVPQVIEGHEEYRKHFKWGSYGVAGDEDKHTVVLKDMSNAHMFNILCTQSHITDDVRFLIATEMYWRLSGRS